MAFGLAGAVTIASAASALAARREAAEAGMLSGHWRGVAAKAYTGLLLTTSPPAEDGKTRNHD